MATKGSFQFQEWVKSDRDVCQRRPMEIPRHPLPRLLVVLDKLTVRSYWRKQLLHIPLNRDKSN